MWQRGEKGEKLLALKAWSHGPPTGWIRASMNVPSWASSWYQCPAGAPSSTVSSLGPSLLHLNWHRCWAGSEEGVLVEKRNFQPTIRVTDEVMSYTASVWSFNRQVSLLAIDLCVFWTHRGFKNVHIHLVRVLPALLLSVMQHDPVVEASEKRPPCCGGVCAMLQGAGVSCWHGLLLPRGQSCWVLPKMQFSSAAFPCVSRWELFGCREELQLVTSRPSFGRTQLLSTELSFALHSLKWSAQLLLLNKVCTWLLLKLLQTVFPCKEIFVLEFFKIFQKPLSVTELNYCFLLVYFTI